MKKIYGLLILTVLLFLSHGCDAAYYLLHDISDSHNQYDKHELPRERQSYKSYEQEREKKLKEDQIEEEQKFLDASRAMSNEKAQEELSGDINYSNISKDVTLPTGSEIPEKNQ